MSESLEFVQINERESWQPRGACNSGTGELINLFFRFDSEQQAKRFCGVCTVRSECLEYALQTEQPWGVWGGLNEEELHIVQRRRRRAS